MTNNVVVGGGCSSSMILTMVKWDIENDLFLSDFVKRCKLPHIGLITKGRYLGVGAPSISAPNLKPYVYVHSKRQIKKLIGQIVKSTGKEGKGQTLCDQKVSISENYCGHFEILSEDGRPAKCIETVQELNDLFPDIVLVRQQCKTYVPDIDGELRSLYKSRIVQEGEILTLCGQFNFKKTSFLRCFDEAGRSVYLKMSQKLKCSPIAKRDAIAGVHNVQNLMSKRLPLTVKLIQGDLSSDLHKYQTNANGARNLIVRLQNIYVEDVVFVYGMHKPDGQFLSVPLNAHLKLSPACNHGKLINLPEFHDLHQLCDDQVRSFYDRITPFNDQQFMYDSIVDVSTNGNDNHSRYASNNNNIDKLHVTNVEIEPLSSLTPPPPPIDDDLTTACTIVCDEEIDQLYDYIRGLAPLPQSAAAIDDHGSSHRRRRRPKPSSSPPPPPPPVDTIPGHNNYARLNNNNNNNSSQVHGNYHSSSSSRHRVSSPKPLPTPSSAQSRSSPIPACFAQQQQQQQLYEPSSSRVQNHSSTSTSPSGTNSACVVDKRLDGILYGSRGAMSGVGLNENHRKLSKSTDKFFAADESSYRRPSATTTNAGEFTVVNSNSPPSAESRYNSHRHHYKNGGGQGQSNRRRPLSMVIPERVPLFNQQTNGLLSSSAKPTAARVCGEYRQTPVRPSAAMLPKNDSSYHNAYRSFVNLPSSAADEHAAVNTYRSRSPPAQMKSFNQQAQPPYQKFAYPHRFVQNPSTHYRI